jgi:hypothetical protein
MIQGKVLPSNISPCQRIVSQVLRSIRIFAVEERAT